MFACFCFLLIKKIGRGRTLKSAPAPELLIFICRVVAFV